jgi:hypothetical protein
MVAYTKLEARHLGEVWFSQHLEEGQLKKRTNIWNIRVPDKRREVFKVYEEIMPEKLPDLAKDKSTHSRI